MAKRNYVTLLLLALIFAAPGLIAYLYYQNPQWLGARTTNKGELLNPPVLLSSDLEDKAKWRFIFWYPRSCEDACLQRVDQLARVRLALGRHMYEVDQWLVVSDNNQLSNTLTQTLSEQAIQILHLSQSTLNDLPVLGDEPKLFIANPKGYLVLAYPENTNLGNIYHDIKRLLSTEKQNG